MEVISRHDQSSDDWHSSLDEAWDSRLPTPLALNHSSVSGMEDEPESQRSLHDGERDGLYIRDIPATCYSSQQNGDDLVAAGGGNNGEYLELAKKGGGHAGLLTVEHHVPTPEPVSYHKKDGQWYTYEGVDVKDTQQRKEMFTSLDSSSQDAYMVVAAGGNNREYLELAKKGGGHKDLLTVEHHVPTPEPVTHNKKDGQWYTHEGVDVKETLQRKEMSTILDTSNRDVDSIVPAGGNNRQYLDLAKKGGGHKDLLTVASHAPSPEPVAYEKKDGQWYGHDGVDVKETQQKKEVFATLNGSFSSQDVDSIVAAGENNREYLELAKKGGGHKDLLTIDGHTPTPEPVMYDRKDGQWYTHDGVDIKDTQQRKELFTTLDSSIQDVDSVVPAGGNNRQYLELARKGGGHKDLLTVEPHVPTPEPLAHDKTDGQWYAHDGVDIKETQQRKELFTVMDSSSSEIDSVVAAGGNTREYLELAKKGGGHKDLLTVEAHVPTSEPVTYDKKDGEWYTHEGVDMKETLQRKEISTILDSSSQDIDSVVAAGGNNREYLDLAKKGGGHKDLLTVEHHVPTPEPVTYDRKDGQWYTHEGVDVKDTQQRKEMSAILDTSREDIDSVVPAGGNNREYLELAKKGGGHKDLLTVDSHVPSAEPAQYDKTDGQWYTQDGVDVKDTLQRKEMTTILDSSSQDIDSVVPAGGKNREYLQMAKKGGGHKDLLTVEAHTPNSQPVTYDKKDGQWYTHDGVDAKETLQRKEMTTVLDSSSQDIDSIVAAGGNNSEYLELAKKGGGHKDMLTVETHTPTPEPVAYDKTDGQWYGHDGVDVKATLQRKEMSTVLDSSSQDVDSVVPAGGNNREYLELAKKGGGHKDLLTVEPHVPTSDPVTYDKKDGQWYTHEGVDIKDTQQRKDLSVTMDGSFENSNNVIAAGGKLTEYLEVAKKGGGHKDLLTVEAHTPSLQPQKYEKKGGDWYNQDDMETIDALEEARAIRKRRQTSSDSAGEVEGETEYLRTARKGGGHTDLLTIEPHTPTPEPLKYDRKDGQWYTHDGVDIGVTQGRKEMLTVCDHPCPSEADSSLDIETDTDYLKIAKKGGGHKDLLTIESHTPTPEPVTCDKMDGQWYIHEGVDLKDTLQRKEMSTILDSSSQDIDNIVPAGGKNREYLQMAKKGGGHKDMLTIEAHTPTPEPVTYDKKDGQWYTHEGVDVMDTQQRKEMVTVSARPRPSSADSSFEVETDTDYLRIAKKGGGHKDLLEIVPHSPTSEPVTYDKTDGQWYTHQGVDPKEMLQRKEMSTTLDILSQDTDSVVAAGGKIREYLELAKKGGGHKELLTVEHHVPTPEPVTYDKKDGQWYTHEGVDVKDTQQRKEMSTILDTSREDIDSVLPAGGNNREYLELAKKGGGHKDLLTVEGHTPTPEPLTYDKKDGQWYTHEGVDVQDTQQRKEMVTVSDRHSVSSADISLDIETDTDYLKIAKKGGGHKDLLTVEANTPNSEPVTYDKKDGQWYTHEGVDIKDTQQRKEIAPGLHAKQDMDSVVAAGGNNREYLELAKKGGGRKDLLEIVPHSPTSEPVTYDKKDGQWYTHEGVDIKDTQQRKDISMTVESARRNSDNLPAAGENDSQYLELARKGGHKDLLTKEDHSPTPEPVGYDKKDGQWYTHEGVDIKDTQQRKGMVTMPNKHRPSSEDSSFDVETDTDYLKIAKKGGGHKDLLTIEAHTPTPEPVTYNRKDGQWYTHDGVDVMDTQQKKEMVTVSARPRPSSADSSFEVETDTDYLRIAKKGGGHKDLLEIVPHSPTPEPITYDKTDGRWYTHEGVDVKETQQKKEMHTIPGSPGHSSANSSVEIDSNTDYLVMARKGGGHKDLLTVESHTPSATPQKYEKKGGAWYNQDGMETLYTPQATSTPRKLRRTYSADSTMELKDETEYLRTARRGGGHKDLLAMEPHTPSTESKRSKKVAGELFSQEDGSPVNTQPSVTSPRSPVRRTSDTDTEYLKTARKGGGHKDLLTIEPHTPSTQPQRYEKKGGDWYNHDSVDGKKIHPKDAHARASPRQKDSTADSSETEYLKTARKGGGHKDLLTIESHKPSPRPKTPGKTLGDWYYQDGADTKESLRRKDSSSSSSPRKTGETSPQGQNDTEYIRMARKGGGHKDILALTPHKASPRPKEVKWNGPTSSVTSATHGSISSKEQTDYLKLSRRDSGQSDRDAGHTRSASQGSTSEYLSIARKGGHHRDLLAMSENNNNKMQETPRSSRSKTPNSHLSWSVQVDGPPRPKTADYRQPHPIWLGGSGPERVHSPGKRFISQRYGAAPYASHDGSPGAAKNPDKI